MGVWRNWYTRSIQNRVASGREGSSPSAPNFYRTRFVARPPALEAGLIQAACFGGKTFAVVDKTLGIDQ
jgi:hypothetical protein